MVFALKLYLTCVIFFAGIASPLPCSPVPHQTLSLRSDLPRSTRGEVRNPFGPIEEAEILACQVRSETLGRFLVLAAPTSQMVRMSTPSRKRLMRDFKRLQQDPPAGISAAPQDNNTMLWNAVISGPDDTPWDGSVAVQLLKYCFQ
ncbi:uncharacterized protein [Elaeis guineensis]|uniref:uncharacterized protein isoform X5 n=1 Tax=Elaeis guineensis var. tenera TaxID=51953 RepID=UPI003C6DB62B